MDIPVLIGGIKLKTLLMIPIDLDYQDTNEFSTDWDTPKITIATD